MGEKSYSHLKKNLILYLYLNILLFLRGGGERLVLLFQQRVKCMDFKKQNHDGSVAKSAVFLQNWAVVNTIHQLSKLLIDRWVGLPV